MRLTCVYKCVYLHIYMHRLIKQERQLVKYIKGSVPAACWSCYNFKLNIYFREIFT